jgi:hypothetical protein
VLTSGYWAFSPIDRNKHALNFTWVKNSCIRCETLTPAEQTQANVWNWGDGPNVAYTPTTSATYFKQKSQLLIDYSLFADLETSLYRGVFSQRKESPLYCALREISDGFLFLMILRLDELQGPGNIFTGRPISHVFSDIVACVDFLRRRAALKPGQQTCYATEYKTLSNSRKTFWHSKLTDVGM